MKLTLKASMLIDLIVPNLLDFQKQLALIDSSVSVMVYAMTELKSTGDIRGSTVKAMQSAQKRLQNIPKAIKTLEIVVPAYDLLANELEEKG